MHQHKAFRQKFNLAKYFVGKNFRWTKLFVGRDIFLSDNVYQYILQAKFKNCELLTDYVQLEKYRNVKLTFWSLA